MLWLPVLGAILVWLPSPGSCRVIYALHDKDHGYLITPKPCSVDGVGGTCMFVWECIKSEGRHVGMCVDTFMFGSCCALDRSTDVTLSKPQDKDILEPAILYTQHSSRPSGGGSVAVQRPVATSRPWGRPQSTQQPPRFTLSTDRVSSGKLPTTHHSPNSIPAGGKPHHAPSGTAVLWQHTTEPAFVTRLKTKPNSGKPRPTKKPYLQPYTTTQSTPKLRNSTVTTDRSPNQSTTTSSPLNSTTTPQEMLATSTFNSVSLTSQNIVNCGVAKLFPQPQTRIVGGRNAPFGRWPWQVSVRRTSFFGFSSTHRCGGAILNENWIATAGHCVDDLLTSQIRIRVGEYDFSSVSEELPYVERGVAKKLVHPKYNFFTYEYDLALVRLDRALEFAPHISPICLPATDDLLIGENATVTGWGRLSEKGTLPSVLQEVSVPIVSNDRCKNMFLRAGRHEFIPEIFLCAGHEGGGRDSCQGDSGGPLQVRGKDGRYFLAGIISWGIGCAEANLPGVCTRVSKFVPWILKNVT